MATIDIKLSQDAFNHQPTNIPSLLVDSIEQVTYASAGQYQSPVSWQLNGTNLVFTYADGATETYTGFVKDNPGADNGTATATGNEVFLKDGVSLHYNGKLNLQYTTTNGKLEVEASSRGLQVNDVGFSLLLPKTDPNYDTVNGNGTMQVKGALNFADTGAVTGTISQLIFKTEKMPSSTIDGNFRVTGNLLTDGIGQTHSNVSGTVTGYHQAFADGSHTDVSGLAVPAASGVAIDVNLLGNPANFGGADTFNIDLPAVLGKDYLAASGDGNDTLTIKGGGGRLNVDAGNGNDRITLAGDAHQVNGGAGLDTVVVQGARADVTVKSIDTLQQGPFGFTLKDKAGATSTLLYVERLVFNDATVALDIEGSAGQAYRLYQAAFNRTPDKGGLGFWINAMDNGTSLQSVAQGFTLTNEYKEAYGDSLSNRELVAKYYQNILHRAPEAAGLDFWSGVLDKKQASVAEVLAGISESAENKAGLIGVMGNGFEYTPFLG